MGGQINIVMREKTDEEVNERSLVASSTKLICETSSRVSESAEKQGQ